MPVGKYVQRAWLVCSVVFIKNFVVVVGVFFVRLVIGCTALSHGHYIQNTTKRTNGAVGNFTQPLLPLPPSIFLWYSTFYFSPQLPICTLFPLGASRGKQWILGVFYHSLVMVSTLSAALTPCHNRPSDPVYCSGKTTFHATVPRSPSSERGTGNVTDTGWQTLWTQTTGN